MSQQPCITDTATFTYRFSGLRKEDEHLTNIPLTIRYDTRCYFNVRSKADMNRLNLPHGDDN